MKKEIPVYEIVKESDIKKVAKRLAVAPFPEQQIAIEDIFAQSAVNGIKVAVETMEIMKKSNDDIAESNKRFTALCDKGIETLKESIKDGEVPEEEKKNVRDETMAILKMAAGSNNNAVLAIKEGRDKAIVAAGVVGGSLGALVILAFVAKAILTPSKK